MEVTRLEWYGKRQYEEVQQTGHSSSTAMRCREAEGPYYKRPEKEKEKKGRT